MFATPQQQTSGSQSGTPAGTQETPKPETPKVGGKWTHPALHGIENEARKAMFGEEELKRLVLNTVLLYAMWWMSGKVEERFPPSPSI